MIDTNLEDQEIADSIKIEASALSPAEDRVVVDKIVQMIPPFLVDFGGFIPQETKERIPQILRKIISVESVPDFVRAFNPESTRDFTNTHSALTKDSRVTILSTEEIWQGLSQEKKDSISPALSSHAKRLGMSIEEFYNLAYVLNHAGHEFSHAISVESSKDELSEEFREVGADYYGEHISSALLGESIIPTESKERVRFYKGLINQYGDDVHKLFFGTDVDPEIKSRILGEINQETAERLLPSRTWLHKKAHKINT